MLSVTLTVRFCQLRVLYLLFLPSCSSFYSSSSSHFMTHTFFCFLFFSFLLSSNLSDLGTTLNFLILYINFSNTYVLYCWFFSILCSFTGFMCRASTSFRSCSLHARYVYFFSFSLLVMLLALTWLNFFHVFSPLHALSNLFLPATCSPSWFL